jgi:hypothetical protein
VANYLDDPSLGDGRWGYVGDDLPPFNHAATHSSYPVSVPATSVNHWAADYLRFLDPASGLDLGFDGNDGTQYAVWALELDPVETTRVTRVMLDAGQAGALTLPDVGSLHERAVMVVANTSHAGATTYAYVADTGTTGIIGSPVAGAGRTLHDGPLAAGAGSVSWNGVTENGVSAPSGIYFFRLETGVGEATTTRAALVR